MTFKHSLNFGGIDSADYGIWLTGSGTFSAPERDIEFVPVPGRNGDLAIDNGRWNNIEVVYPANIPNDFDNRMAAFRAELCRKRGYQRLEDTYHPDEFRMGVFGAGIDPEMIPLNRGGDFNLVFNCKPQRYLKSGDIPLQFMPWVPSSHRTQYIPAIEGDAPAIIAHCPAGTTLSINYSTYNSEYVRTSYNTGTIEDGDIFYGLVTSSDAYWRFEITNTLTDPDNTYCEIKAHTIYNGEEMEINALFTGLWVYHNPTGYASKPLIECYGGQLPYITWTNYIDGVEDFYYDFHTNATGETHFWMDCDTQYLYDDDKNNLTNYLILTTAGTDTGEGMEFPELGEDEIRFEMSFPDSDPANGLGIVNIWPRWYRL